MGMWFLLIPEHPWDEVDRFPRGSSAIRKKTDLKEGKKKGTTNKLNGKIQQRIISTWKSKAAI